MLVPAGLPPSLAFPPSGPLHFRLDAYLPTVGADFTREVILWPHPEVVVARVDVDPVTQPVWDPDNPPGVFVAEARDVAELVRIVQGLVAQAISGVVLAPEGTPDAVLEALRAPPRLVRILPPTAAVGREASIAAASRALALVLGARVVRMFHSRALLRAGHTCVMAAVLDDDLFPCRPGQGASLDWTRFTAIRLAVGCGWPELPDAAVRLRTCRRTVDRWCRGHVPQVLLDAVAFEDAPSPVEEVGLLNQLQLFREDHARAATLAGELARLRRAMVMAESFGPGVALARIDKAVVKEALKHCGGATPGRLARWLRIGRRQARTLLEMLAPA